MNNEFLPHLDKDREMCVQYFGEGWKGEYSLSFILAEGAPARISAITQALHQFRPSYIHVLRPKSYRDENFLRLDGVQFLPWDEASVAPAITVKPSQRYTGIREIDMRIGLLVQEMWKFKQTIEDGNSLLTAELGRFWLRKTRKPVISILLVEKPDSKETSSILRLGSSSSETNGSLSQSTNSSFYRGINLEVSMPTGSLCSERNCIGTAIACDPSLKREHIKMIAVLSLPSIDWLQKREANLAFGAGGGGGGGGDLYCPTAPSNFNTTGGGTQAGMSPKSEDAASPRDVSLFPNTARFGDNTTRAGTRNSLVSRYSEGGGSVGSADHPYSQSLSAYSKALKGNSVNLNVNDVTSNEAMSPVASPVAASGTITGSPGRAKKENQYSSSVAYPSPVTNNYSLKDLPSPYNHNARRYRLEPGGISLFYEDPENDLPGTDPYVSPLNPLYAELPVLFTKQHEHFLPDWRRGLKPPAGFYSNNASKAANVSGSSPTMNHQGSANQGDSATGSVAASSAIPSAIQSKTGSVNPNQIPDEQVEIPSPGADSQTQATQTSPTAAAIQQKQEREQQSQTQQTQRSASGLPYRTRRGNRSLSPLKNQRQQSSSKGDLNPIDPCGACMEWLMKIADKEPNFRVITFESYKCDKIYVKRVRAEG